jgi:hypothetical protein
VTTHGVHAEVCSPNIGPRQRRARLTFGLVMVAGTLGWIALALTLGLPRVGRFLTFAPAWLGALGVFQYLEKT